MGKNGICYGCDENVEMLVNQLSHKCNRCSNRSYRNAGYSLVGWCVPSGCPSDKPVMSNNGVCYPCGTNVAVRNMTSGVGSVQSCSQCPSQSVFDDYMCMMCPSNMVVEDGVCTCEEGFVAGYANNNADNTYRSLVPTCHSCASTNLNAIAYWYGNTTNPCSACPDRMIVRPYVHYYHYCALKTCPTGYMHNRYGHCVSCSGSNNIEAKPSSLTNACSECGGLRYTDGNYCKKCPAQGTAAWNSLSDTQRAECSVEASS